MLLKTITKPLKKGPKTTTIHLINHNPTELSPTIAPKLRLIKK